VHVGGIFDLWLGHVHGARHTNVINLLFNSKLYQFNFESFGQTQQGFFFKKYDFQN